MNTRDVLVGVGLGATLAYMADPQTGRRRRALARDQLLRTSRKTRDALDATARDIANRTAGVVAATRGRLVGDDEVDDVRLIERVRAKLGRVCSHPRAIDVFASDGGVTLRGPILADEETRVLDSIAGVRGVREVRSELQVHESADGVPSLQGDARVPGDRLDLFQRNWAPATQALVAALGLVAAGAVVAEYTRR